MKLFPYAFMTTLFLFVGCESYDRQNDKRAFQEQQEREDDKAATSEAVETKPFPEKGGNAGNR